MKNTFFASLCLVMLLLIAGPVMAGDREEIMKALKGGNDITSMRISAPWALGSWSEKDMGGYVLLRKLEGKWLVITGSGGALDPGGLFRYGVPPELWDKLLTYKPTEEERKEALASGPQWDLLSKNTIDESDVKGKTAWVLILMRNEIYARHGRAFTDQLLRDYFTRKKWYKANASFNDSMLTETEMTNGVFILDYQKKHNLEKPGTKQQ